MTTIAQLSYHFTFRVAETWLGGLSRRHFPAGHSRVAAYIAGVLWTFKAATATAVAEGGAYSYDAMRRLLVGESLRPVLQNAALSLIRREKGYLVLDDVVIGKEGEHIEGIARLFSPGEERFVKGLNVVVLGWTDGNTYVPLSFRFWKPPAVRYADRKPSATLSTAAASRRSSSSPSTCSIGPINAASSRPPCSSTATTWPMPSCITSRRSNGTG